MWFFSAVLHEIEDRRQFLADMEALGQEREYISIINAEISQVQSILTKPEPFSVENVMNLHLWCVMNLIKKLQELKMLQEKTRSPSF